MKKVTFYYCRHGETMFNKIGRMQGFCDSPLTEKGIRQAYQAGELLKDVPFTHAYCSTSERTRDTAAYILEGRNVPLTPMKGLKEINFGTYEGVLTESRLEEINQIRLNTEDWTAAGGENRTMVYERIQRTYEQILKECQDGDQVLIVSHGAVFMQYFPALFHIDKNKFFTCRKEQPFVPNGYVGTFTCTDGEMKLTSFYSDDELVDKLYDPSIDAKTNEEMMNIKIQDKA